MLLIAGISKRIGLIIAAGVLVLGMGLVMVAPHRMDRITTFFRGDNSSTSDTGSYHVENAKIAIGTGGLFGVGVGNQRSGNRILTRGYQ